MTAARRDRRAEVTASPSDAYQIADVAAAVVVGDVSSRNYWSATDKVR